jgi:endonuclease III
MNQKIALAQLRELKKLKKEMRLAAEGWDKDWKILIATLLSARTRDEKTILVCEDFFEKYSLKEISKLSLKKIQEEIRQINFYRNKSRNVKNCAKELVIKYQCEVPKVFDELIKLPGVGRKTANVFLAVIGKDEIGIDTHVTYISKKLNWSSGKNQKEIEKDLKNLFPKNKWREINYHLVGFGRSYKSKNKKDEILENLISRYSS